MTQEAIRRLMATEKGQVGLDRIVDLVHRHLGLDLVYVAELVADKLLFRAVAGDTDSFDVALDGGGPSDGTYSRLLVEGKIPAVIPNAATDARVSDLPATKLVGIGAFIGVPLRLSEGTRIGTLCGIDHNPDPTLGERDVRFMTMLGELIADDLDEQGRKDQLRDALLNLIETENIDIAYQPIVDIRGGDCLGVEALSRFPDPLGPPDRLFAEASSVGLSLDLERLAIRQSWHALEHLDPQQFLAVNVSPGALMELARRAQQRSDLPLGQLVVEITEQTVVECYEDLRDVIAPLRAEGLRISVDDAGAGYASLHHIVELRPDFIKIDRSFVHGLADDHALRVVVNAFVRLSLDLGATVIAEGVERSRDLAALCDLGVDAAQGYLLGRPSIHRDDLTRWATLPSRPDHQVALS
jgi:EAL domain-containing protein (putative c-di-GMP-specific phosphodiesterase class I)